MSERNDRHLVIAALAMAYFQRRPAPGLIHHGDRGSVYCSHDYQKQLEHYGMLCSMSGKGNCYDNAPIESWFKTLKVERVNSRRYATRAQARSDVFSYIETFYNPRRRHSSLGCRRANSSAASRQRRQPDGSAPPSPLASTETG
jgi:putative transposase